MIHSKIEALLFLSLVLIKQNYAQLTAVITPRGYNASLDPEASFTFQCDVTGTNNIQWLVDDEPLTIQEITDRGISQSNTITVDEANDSFRSSLSILRNIGNRNTTVICLANVFSSMGVSGVASELVVFKIQGLLDAPSNLTLSVADNQRMKTLSWDKPFSLDITDVDPDIECYNVCYSLVNVTAEKSQCTCVNQTEYTFLNLNINLLFIVSAVNVVGVGNSSTALHEATDCNTTDPSIINFQSLVSFSGLSGTNPVVKFLFQQLLIMTDRETACYFVYSIETSPISKSSTIEHGIQIPSVVSNSQTSVQLSLTVDSELVVNEEYYAMFASVYANGEANNSETTIEFDTYDLQLVNGTVLQAGGVVELSCTFAEGSHAQSCILSLCRMEDDIEEPCRNVTINREENTVNQTINLQQAGLYIIREVAEVESDGQLTIHRKKNVLELRVNEPPPFDSPSESVINTVTVLISVGSAVALAFVLLILAITIAVFVYTRKKLQRVVRHPKDHIRADSETGIYECPV